MAAPKTKPTKLQQDQTRAAIQTTQLVKRLQCYALGLPAPNAAEDDDKPLVMDSGQLRAAEILLKKSLPDLQAVTISGDPDNPLKTEEVGGASAKLVAYLDTLAERSTETGEPPE